MRKTTHVLMMAALFGLTLSACRTDDDLPEVPQPVVNEPEQITTVELHMDKADGSHVRATWSDPDGPGGNEPTIDDIALDTGSVYTVEVHFYDESGDSPVEVTNEIREEGDEHFICFELDPMELSNALSITPTDSDGTYAIGLDSEWTTTDAATGTLTLKLKHQVGGEKDGTCEPGGTDVEVVFNVAIQ
jgi:hypothetical protein